MTDQFLGEIRLFAGNFAPTNWALCNGQLMAIKQNTALFSLLGINYGGDGRVTFGLPNLQGSTPIGAGEGQGLSRRELGEEGGAQSVTLTVNEMASHRHAPNATTAQGNTGSPRGARWATSRLGRQSLDLYAGGAPNRAMSLQSVAPTGGGQPHNNMPPYQVLNYIIALTGIYPARP